MPARTNRLRKKAPKSTNPAQKRTMRASGLSSKRSSRLSPSTKKRVAALKVTQRPPRVRGEKSRAPKLKELTPKVRNEISREVTGYSYRDLLPGEKVIVDRILKNRGYDI
tara:strand:+ start:1832 stop:2161 length:330 start_codon:yes stop_codon:yes gene_type:complete